MAGRATQYIFECPHCGRIWDASEPSLAERRAGNSAVGYVKAGARHHIECCARRSPADRRAINILDKKRWSRRPPSSCKIRLDHDHEGLREDTREGWLFNHAVFGTTSRQGELH